MRQLIYNKDFSVPGAPYYIDGILNSSSNISYNFNFTTKMPKKLMIQRVVGNGNYQYAPGYAYAIILTDIKTGKQVRVSLNGRDGSFTANIPTEFITDGFKFELQGGGDNGFSYFSLRFYGMETITATINIDGNRYGLSGSQLTQIPETADERTLFSKGFDIKSIDTKAVTQSISKISKKFHLNIIEK